MKWNTKKRVLKFGKGNRARWKGLTKHYCEAQGKGRARDGPRKVTQRSFMDGGWWMVDILSLMLYTKFGCVTFPPPSLLISRIKLIMDQVR